MLDVTFKAGVDRVGVPDLTFTEMQFLYSDSSSYTFMDNNTYDQVNTNEETDTIYFIRKLY